jgi:membrane-anchored protein YejM (alkaline phosphatase superfamily)
MLIFITVVEKFTFGFASLFDNKNITLATKNIPLYQPLTFNSIAEKYFGYEKRVKKRQTLSISNSNGVEYPIKKVELESPKAINIFMIGIDGLRDDMITPEITPNIYRFAKESLWFRGNRSGGNATRFGIFTLFYGLNSQYWFNFIDAKREPVFFDVLKRLNYDISILFSTSTKWPEFRETVFFGVQEKIKDRIDSKDTKTFEMWMRYIENIPKNRAIFNFTFFNAPHGRYYPKKFAKFKPDRGGEINYLLVKKRDKNVLLNQYKNAIHYDDYLFGKMVDRLKQKALYKNSIIILTSDHGEEFYEYGYFGHNTAFDVAQTNSPIVIKIPNQKAKVIKKLSSTLDLIPSLLKLLGVVNSPSDYSNGVDNLFSESYLREFATSGNWNYSAIVTPKFTYLFSTLPNRVASTQKLYTETYREIDDEVDIADSLMQKFIIEVLNQNRRFLKSN